MASNTRRRHLIQYSTRLLGLAAAFGTAGAAGCSGPAPDENTSAAQSALSMDLVIAEVYGGGGNSGAPYTNDFVVIFNRGLSAASLNGLSIQYASAGGDFSSSSAIALPNVMVQPGKYFLLQMGGGSNGVALPTPDATATTNMSGTNGKVALVSVPLDACGKTASPCPTTNVVDFVGYGNAQQFEGSGATGTLSNTKSAQRKGAGCIETDDNAADFDTAAPTPRNSATAAASCTGVDAGTGGTGGAGTGGAGTGGAGTGGAATGGSAGSGGAATGGAAGSGGAATGGAGGVATGGTSGSAGTGTGGGSAGTATGGASSGGAGGNTGGFGNFGGNLNNPGSTSKKDDSGCSCRMPRSSNTPGQAWLLSLLGLGLLTYRRRR